MKTCKKASLIYVVKSTVKCFILACTQQCTWLTHVVRNVLKKPALNGPLKADIGLVKDSRILLTENKAYWDICHSYQIKRISATSPQSEV